MIEKCQSNQKKFMKSFERVFQKLSCESEESSGTSFHSFHSLDFKVTKMDQPFFSKDSMRNLELKNANLFYREFSKKFEKFKKVFASLVELSNKFNETIQEFVSFMDETYNKTFTEPTEESEKKSFSFFSQKNEPLLTSIFQKNEMLPLIHQDEIMDLKFINLPLENSENSNCLVSCSKDKSIRFFDINTRKLTHTICNLPHHINQIAYCPDSNVLAASLSNDIIKLWRYNTEFSFLQDLKSHSDIVWGLQFIQNGTKMISSSFDSSVRYWDLEKGKNEFLFKVPVKEGKVYGLVYLNDKKLISVAGQNSIFFFDERDPKICKMTIKNAHENQITKLDYSQNYSPNHLASCSKDNKVKIWDLSRKGPIHEFQHEDYVYGIKFLNPYKMLASASDDKTIKIWNLEENKLIQSFQDHSDFVKTCQWDENSKILASAGKDRKIVIRYL